MEFKPLTLDHIDELRPYFKDCKSRICDCTVGGTFMWRDYFKTEYAREDGTLFLRVCDFNGGTAYAMPMGGDVKAAILKIERFCRENGILPEFCMVPAEQLAFVLSTLPGAHAHTDSAWSDYLYSAEDIKNLAGRKYQGQRNHINKFCRQYDGRFEVMDKALAFKTIDFLEKFIEKDTGGSVTLTEGNEKALEMLKEFDRYKPLGGVLTVGGEIIGFSLGEIVYDTLFIHVEKSLREFEGSYPMLVREFARCFAGDGVAYINREEDDGDEGLRTSKSSYHPVKLLEKYAVTLF